MAAWPPPHLWLAVTDTRNMIVKFKWCIFLGQSLCCAPEGYVLMPGNIQSPTLNNTRGEWVEDEVQNPGMVINWLKRLTEGSSDRHKVYLYSDVLTAPMRTFNTGTESQVGKLWMSWLWVQGGAHVWNTHICICIRIHIRMVKQTQWAVHRLQSTQINVLAFENLPLWMQYKFIFLF